MFRKYKIFSKIPEVSSIETIGIVALLVFIVLGTVIIVSLLKLAFSI